MGAWGLIVRGVAFGAGVVYPAYASVTALETFRSDDDAQWLTYWFIFGVLHIFEALVWPILSWVPLYQELKALFLVWLVLPQLQGAKAAYLCCVRPGLAKAVSVLRDIPALESIIDSMPACRTLLAERDAAERHLVNQCLETTGRIEVLLDSLLAAYASATTEDARAAARRDLESLIASLGDAVARVPVAKRTQVVQVDATMPDVPAMPFKKFADQRSDAAVPNLMDF